MSIRGRMTMRAAISRNVGTGASDPYGQPVRSSAEVSSILPCYIQPASERTLTNEGKFLSVTMLRGWFPPESGVENEDVVTEVRDRAGRVLHEGRRRVISLVKRETHLDAILEEYA